VARYSMLVSLYCGKPKALWRNVGTSFYGLLLSRLNWGTELGILQYIRGTERGRLYSSICMSCLKRKLNSFIYTIKTVGYNSADKNVLKIDQSLFYKLVFIEPTF